MIESAADSKATIFVKGESGTGKELCARAIHDESPRRKGPFIALNCAAIPKELMESEIFGHIRGSFSGAIADRDGAASAADRGTLFLDEICEMDINLQSKLLRFLQTETFQRVGSSDTENVDIRFICATNRDPLAEVHEGRFREDLYYRLHVIPLELPPLRDRGEDTITLATSFLSEYAGQENKDFETLSMATRALLLSHTWPGNVRELQNVMRQVVVLNDGDEVTPDMLPMLSKVPGRQVQEAPDTSPREQPTETARSANEAKREPLLDEDNALEGDMEELASLIKPLADVERDSIEQAIKLCDGKVRIAATLLGISHATLYRKINSWKDGVTE
jgi:two-component system, repressor protein LuxO